MLSPSLASIPLLFLSSRIRLIPLVNLLVERIVLTTLVIDPNASKRRLYDSPYTSIIFIVISFAAFTSAAIYILFSGLQIEPNTPNGTIPEDSWEECFSYLCACENLSSSSIVIQKPFFPFASYNLSFLGRIQRPVIIMINVKTPKFTLKRH